MLPPRRAYSHGTPTTTCSWNKSRDEYPRSHRVEWCRWSGKRSVPGKPSTVVMVMNLVAVTDSSLFHPTVSANVEHRWELLPFIPIGGQVEIARDVKPRAGLVVKVLHGKSIPLELARDRSLSVRGRSGESPSI